MWALVGSFGIELKVAAYAKASMIASRHLPVPLINSLS